MSIILISLLLKTLFYTKNIKKNLGSFIIHVGIIMLILGGFITALFGQEGYLKIPEGKQSHIILDYHDVELALINKSTNKTKTFKQKLLNRDEKLLVENGLVLEIKEFIKNTEPVQRQNPASNSFKGFSKIFELKKKPLEKINESNRAGLTFQISNKNKKEIYSVFEGMPIEQTIKWKNKTYIATLRPIQTYLPFSIHLIDFEKKHYPGTYQPKSYQSTVEIWDQSRKQKRVIKMNQPLRYKGWTFYQSAFIEKDNSEETVLAGVKNIGRGFPYLSSLVICFGLLIHILINVSVFKRRENSL